MVLGVHSRTGTIHDLTASALLIIGMNVRLI
jgi:hypothetical protein